MTAELPAGLVRWARLPGPALVLRAVRDRAERGQATERGRLSVPLTAAERGEVARLLGVSWDISGRAVHLQDLAAALAEHGLTVRACVEAWHGAPIVDRRTRREACRAAADVECAAVLGELVAAGVAETHAAEWLIDPGLPAPGSGRVAELAGQVGLVLRRLPAVSGLSLAQLAAAACADAHALDYRRPLGRAVARMLAIQHGLPSPRRAGRDWRAVWATVGVRCDAVSSRVLALNLPLVGSAPAARLTTAAPGEPVWLSLRALAGDWTAATARRVFVCENVTVLEAAAEELGPRCPPMVGTDGIPTTAGIDLVAGLAAAGCPISVRADVDEAGFVVVEQIRRAAPGALPWRFDVATYARQLRLAAEPDRSAGGPVDDPEDVNVTVGRLRALFAEHGSPVHEEQLLDELLGDLRAESAD